MNPNNFPWTNRDWKRKRQNKRKWNNNRSGTVWCSVPTIGSVKATRAGQSWLMRIWKGRQLSPHIRLGLLWYLIFPNSFLVIQKKQTNILRDEMLRAISLMTFCLWPVREKPCSAQQWEKFFGRQKHYCCKLSIGRVDTWTLDQLIVVHVCIKQYEAGESQPLSSERETNVRPELAQFLKKCQHLERGEKWHVPEDPFSNISFRFGERRSARWSDVRVWQKSGSKREKIKVTKTSKPGCKMLSVFFLKFTE